MGDLAYRSGELGEELAEAGVLLAAEKANRHRAPIRQQVEVCFAALKRVFGMERTLAKTLTESCDQDRRGEGRRLHLRALH